MGSIISILLNRQKETQCNLIYCVALNYSTPISITSLVPTTNYNRACCISRLICSVGYNFSYNHVLYHNIQFQKSYMRWKSLRDFVFDMLNETCGMMLSCFVNAISYFHLLYVLNNTSWDNGTTKI